MTAGKDLLLLRTFWSYSEVIMLKIKGFLSLSLKEKGQTYGLKILQICAAG